MKNQVNIFLICLMLLPVIAFGDTVKTYFGSAYKRRTLVYKEKHEVTYDKNGALKIAQTTYTDPDGKMISILKSDFSKSFTAPDHIIRDFRTGNVQGLRIDGPNIILFNQDKGEKEESKTLSKNFGGDRLAFGCQGLGYYLLKNMEDFKKKKIVPIKFLLPGSLESYDFVIEYLDEEDGIVDLEIKIESWILKLFAPKLEVKYDIKKNRIVWYRGISNITNKRGRQQKVTITYEYPEDK